MMPAVRLSRQELELLGFVRAYTARRGYAPSFREMARAIRMRGFGQLSDLLDDMQRRGLIRRIPFRARAIEILRHPPASRAPGGAPLFFVPPPTGEQQCRTKSLAPCAASKPASGCSAPASACGSAGA